MTKYIGTFSITVESNNEADMNLLSEEIGEAAKRLGLMRTAEEASLVLIEDYD